MKSWILAFLAGVLLAAPAAAQRTQRISNGWGWAGIAASTLDNQATPAPSPTPKPGDVCKQCKGSGKVGDGVVFSTCRECNGTGKVIARAVSAIQQRASDILLSSTTSPSDRKLQSSEIAAPGDCANGQCSTPAIKSTPALVQDCSSGVCVPVRQTSSRSYSNPQPQTVRRGWIFRR